MTLVNFTEYQAVNDHTYSKTNKLSNEYRTYTKTIHICIHIAIKKYLTLFTHD